MRNRDYKGLRRGLQLYELSRNRTHHRQDTDLGCFGEYLPSVDDFLQFGGQISQLRAKCAAFCAALCRNRRFSRDVPTGSESLPDYSLYAANIVVNLASANW